MTDRALLEQVLERVGRIERALLGELEPGGSAGLVEDVRTLKRERRRRRWLINLLLATAMPVVAADVWINLRSWMTPAAASATQTGTK